ncbi:hypothetical protein E3Q22_01305 [Wallemia mellicola]|uniref:Translation initiation factor 3 N-terminal domain-containing protein n=1 Tax=Wallemia mellicola TaxID=1708541 RepID=A0A4V4MZZ2_9BASI|nr:hypothetical protein E3Q22_01305 [Wallemia mellicola]TIB82304.1 hypothetical protein E3Q21_03468 [Wallemia mellicola]TIB85116.1 hypothetical protein E3Q20_03423 [Wallemia mellicola]TIC14408.1 hypothetical protein E3Q14_00762 [Wallemia mellicola]TIC21053.1 hypothetical protein E3Q13_00263 [Wallemia mellicola]
MQRLLSNLPKAGASYNTFRAISTTSVLHKAAGRLRDEDIVKAFDKISVVDSVTGKPQLGEDSRAVLRSIERSKYRLEVVSESGDIPLVKIIDKSEEYRKAKEKSNKEKEAKAAKSAKSKLEKEIQLTWMTSPHDLTHKLKKAHEVLSQKGKVSVVFANSSAHKRIPDVEKERIMNNVELQLGLGMNTNVARWKETEKTKRFWGFHLKGV